GEGNREALDALVEKLIAEYKDKNAIESRTGASLAPLLWHRRLACVLKPSPPLTSAFPHPAKLPAKLKK
ncbi:MAG: hypothetical protein ICV80_11835, partial [Microcoleus sp. T1-bin1]|nr:hypothetical protein [Microcoleus sp. T1-bin1]